MRSPHAPFDPVLEAREALSVPATEFNLAEAVQDANKMLGCQLCRGIRFKTCKACGQGINSYGDFRDSQRPTQVYETQREWREVNGTPEQDVPDRKLQP